MRLLSTNVLLQKKNKEKKNKKCFISVVMNTNDYSVAGPHSLVDRRVDSLSIRFLTAVVRASLRSHVRKPSSAYGWSGGFSPGSPVFAHLS